MISCFAENFLRLFHINDLYFIFIPKDHEPMWTKELRKLCKTPAREFTFKMKIWNPQSWIVTEHHAGESRVVPTKIQRSNDDTVTFKR